MVYLARLLLAALPLLGACEFVYDAGDLPPQNLEAGQAGDAPRRDALQPADVELIADADPDALALTGVEPSFLEEGQGVGGSTSTILLIHGMQIVANQTTVAITVHGGSAPAPGITVDNTQLDVAADGEELAVPVAFAIDVARGSAAPRTRVDVTVTQMGAAGLVTRTLAGGDADPPVLELAFLDELTNASPEFTAGAVAPGTYRYSQVTVTGGLRPATSAGPLRITAVSSLSITGVTDAKAVLGTPGGGGNGGGNGGGASTLGPALAGGKGGGVGGGLSSGGGGGFGTAGSGAAVGGPVNGDEALRDLAADRSSGGGGGVGGVGIGAAGGGVGGAGGGVLELTAGGDLSLGDLTTIGGNGTPTAAAGNGGGGGGGTGGTVLLRARHTATFTSVTATGGLAGGGGSVASFAGGNGRVRIDEPVVALTLDSTPAAFRGPMLATGTKLIVRTALPTLTVIGAVNKSFSYYFTNHDGAQAGAAQLIGPSGMQSLTIPPAQPLARGINHFCLLVEGADASSPVEAQNCYDLVYLYTP